MTEIKTPDFSLTGSLLVAQYNEMVQSAVDLGVPHVREVNRFADSRVGVERTKKLHEAIQARAQALRDADEEQAERDALGVVETNPGSETAAEGSAPEGNSAPEGDEAPGAEAPGEQEADDMAKRAKKGAAKKRVTKTTRAKSTGPRVKSTNGTTIREKTEEYNTLVPQAKKLGLEWPKHHTSNFESQVKADAALEKLRKAMKEASKARG